MTSVALTNPKVAVLLNANAKRVSRRVHNALRHVVPEDDLFLSKSEKDAREIARTVVDRQYRTVFTGGGDGTFVSFVTEIHRFLSTPEASPRFGVLKLGTGNALAGMVGATAGEGILDDVLRARAGEVPNVRRIDLLQAEGRLTPFAGIGLDAKVLNDYMRTKKKLAAGRWKSLATGGPGYALAVAGRTLPWVLTHRKSPEIEVVNTGGTAYLMGRDGNPVREFAPGEVMFRGRSKVCAAGTVPYYGFGFRMFPYAGSRRGKMQLRLTDLPALKILSHLDSIWAGRFRDEGLFDFLADSVVIRSEEKLPFQVGGDDEGYRDEVSLEVAPSPVDLVDFTAALA
jgi:diacylglycerol kinase family enzyme